MIIRKLLTFFLACIFVPVPIRALVAFVIHLFSKEPWDNMSQLFLIFSTIGAFIIWGIDELLRKVADWESIQSGM
ncbi:hypothetical protein FZC76_14850 [Sutcliffiella horikoshii]|uniref:Uncharacterized protein n=1 Tax=Sutcliffiella horikoshii TaxID=79883 RepID=A0A5D4T0Q4_9BACI|nr:hypothetical protein [Sutcliffiella horikoshii]TYS67834.1 hypothetical protein FZC76_14850 [Sutcliffiella horikoshii]